MPVKLRDISVPNYERVVEATDPSSGLHALIAIHNTVLGPALGGTRIYPYSSDKEALNDVLRLAEGMTYKSALAETGLGGGKSVIIADPKKEKTEALLSSFGEAIQLLGGSYICAEDVGTSTSDMLIIRKKTAYVAGLPLPTSSGDPSRFTARGIYQGLRAVAHKLWGSTSLKKKRIAIQGMGSVGLKVAEWLYWEGAHLIMSDIDPERLQQSASIYHATALPHQEILAAECDILCPCALGGILNENSIAKLRCQAVAGAANNQLLTEEDGMRLHKKNILYAPDFVINAGGIINVVYELAQDRYHPHFALDSVDRIYETLTTIFEKSEREHLPTSQTAIELAKYKLEHKIGKRKSPICFH